MVILTLTRNPFYLALVIGAVAVVRWRCAPVALENNGQQAMLLSPLRFGLFVVPFAALFNALMVHVGTTELFGLPRGLAFVRRSAYSWRRWFMARSMAWRWPGCLAAFAVVNRIVPVRALIQLIPRTYYPVAVVVAIAITFVPVTLQQWQQIREAQAVRGHRLGGVRSWLPLVCRCWRAAWSARCNWPRRWWRAVLPAAPTLRRAGRRCWCWLALPASSPAG